MLRKLVAIVCIFIMIFKCLAIGLLTSVEICTLAHTHMLQYIHSTHTTHAHVHVHVHVHVYVREKTFIKNLIKILTSDLVSVSKGGGGRV